MPTTTKHPLRWQEEFGWIIGPRNLQIQVAYMCFVCGCLLTEGGIMHDNHLSALHDFGV